MKYFKIIIIFCTLCFFTKRAQSQTQWWGGVATNKIVEESELIFEGEILTDSVFQLSPPGAIATYHKVLLLKKFKGTFKSDTIIVVNLGGRMIVNGEWEGGRKAYARKDDKALFLVNTYWNKKPESPDFYFIGYGDGCGFVKVCDKKDVVKEVYEPIEKVTGQSYVEVHPNSCKTK